jgi:hypothetical protein
MAIWATAILALLASTTFAASRWYQATADNHAAQIEPTTDGNRSTLPIPAFDQKTLESELRDRVMAAATEISPNEPTEFQQRLVDLQQAIDTFEANHRAPQEGAVEQFGDEVSNLTRQLLAIEPPENH